jgi:N-acetylmuramoyl-L-alanine amidase
LARRLGVPLVLLALGCSLLAVTLPAAAPLLPFHYTVFIDPGHGGKDPGAIGVGGVEEKTITLAIAQMVYLNSLGDPDLTIVLSRRDDEYSFPTDRALEADRIGADLYISIHANAFSDPHISGVETLVHETKPQTSRSYQLAEVLQRDVVSATGADDRGVKWAPLFIRAAKMPAALVEVGFVTNPTEARLLQRPSYEEKIANGILKAIHQFLHVQ